ELPALVDEARHRPEHVGDERGGDPEREKLHDAAPAGAEVVEPEPDAHQLAMAEGVAEREEGSGGAQPGDDVVGAAHQDAELAAERLRQPQREDRKNAKSGEDAAPGIEAVEEPPQPTCRDSA